MIVITLKLWGAISLGTFHIPLPIDLPAMHFTGKIWQLTYDVTTGPKHALVPEHSTAAVHVKPKEGLGAAETLDSVHEPASPDLDAWS